MSLGLYISVPFCKTKCSYCNFASDVFSRAVFEKYTVRLCSEIVQAAETTHHIEGVLQPTVDSIYLGGRTPTLLNVTQLEYIFVTIRQNFTVLPSAEITVECAPGTLSPSVIEGLQRCGVNRVSLGVQSFDDHESASVGRLHKRLTVIDDIERLRSAGIANINVDLIAGLPHQTLESWHTSLDQLISLAVPHASIYMLEVDEDSRLGRELIAGGQKYHAHFVPDEDLTADMYEIAGERLSAAGIAQYEISNFARTGFESRHNLKYWTRQPYLGFGVDAHSMLPSPNDDAESVRLATTDDYDRFFVAADFKATAVRPEQALEESFFLGLRLNRGVDLERLREEFGAESKKYDDAIAEFVAEGLLLRVDDHVRLTSRGRLL